MQINRVHYFFPIYIVNITIVQIKSLHPSQNHPVVLLQCGILAGVLILHDQRHREPVERLHLFELDRCIIGKVCLLGLYKYKLNRVF